MCCAYRVVLERHNHPVSLAAIMVSHVIFISEHSEMKLIRNNHTGSAPQNGCGLEQLSGGDAELGTDEER